MRWMFICECFTPINYSVLALKKQKKYTLVSNHFKTLEGFKRMQGSQKHVGFVS